MSLIKDLTKVRDEEITLQDVKRAEEIIARANKLLGKTEKGCSHYHWDYVRPYLPNYWYGGSYSGTVNLCANGTTTKNNTLTVSATNGTVLSANSNIVEASLMAK